MENWAVMAGIVGGSAAIAAAAIVFWYRKKQRETSLRRIREISKDIEYAMEERGTRHPQLVQHKIDAAEERWAHGRYREAERIMEDVFRLVQLS